MPEDSANHGGRAEIIANVKTPLGFFTLVVLVVEVILGLVAARASGTDFTIILLGMLLSLFVLIAAVVYLHKPSPPPAVRPAEPTPKHDVFISAPMAAFGSDEEFKKNKEEVLQLIGTLKEECRFRSIIYAGLEINSMADFDAMGPAAEHDIQAIRDSKFFILWYPQKLASSVLFEAGVALALRKPAVYFVRNRDDLPYLMRNLDHSFHQQVRIEIAAGIENILLFFEREREDLFPKSK